jgi:hypothetical protein
LDVDTGDPGHRQTPALRHNLPFVNGLGGDAKMTRRFAEAAHQFDGLLTRDHPWIIGGKFQIVSHDLMLGAL